MPITNKLKFATQERTSQSSTSATTWSYAGTALSNSHLRANNEYFILNWVNCTSPGTNDGATKLAFEGGAGDLIGSVHQRHDTNSSGMYVGHLGQFTCPDPPESIGIYRKRLFGSNPEDTDYGQTFIIDLSFSGVSGAITSGTDFSSNIRTDSRTIGSTNNIATHTVNHAGTNLVAASVKITDANVATDALIGLYIDGSLVSSGSRYSQDASDMKQVILAGAYNISSGEDIELRNLDTNNVSTDYSYIFALNLDDAPAVKHTGQMLSWTDHNSSGTWGTQTIDGNQDRSFIMAMGRQLETGAESGRQASISLRNNTTNQWMLFGQRPSGNFDPIYFPAVNYGADQGQLETSVIIGTGDIGDAAVIEMVSL